MLTLNEISLALGERRTATVEVTADGAFEIASAAYALSRNGVVEDGGVCVVDGHELRLTLEPREAGYYTLKITFEIGPERLVAKGSVSVT